MTDPPEPETPPIPARPSPPRAALALLGACAVLAVVFLSEGALLPEIDRTPPRAVGLAVAAVLLSAGWWASTRRTRRVDGGLVLLAGGALLAGGGASLLLAAPLHDGLVRSVAAGDGRLPYVALVALHVAGSAAPLLLPLGALVGLAVGAAGRRSTTALLLGAGLALAMAPVVGDEWLGRRDALAAIVVLGAGTAVSLLRRTPWTCEPARLDPGAGTALLALGAVVAMTDALARPHVDLGTNDTPWLAASVVLAAVVGSAVGRVARVNALDGLVAVALAWTLTATPVARAHPTIPPELSLLRLALVGVPAGLVVGSLLARRGAGVPLSVAPALLVVGAPAVVWKALPGAGPLPLAAGLAALLVLAALQEHPRPRPLRALAGLAAAAAALFLAELPGDVPGTPVLVPHHLADGHAAWLRDPADGRGRLAIDGAASLSRHPLQEHRLVHVPWLLQGGHAERVLVVATDTGEAEGAAREHAPRDLDWLRPFPVPGVAALDPEPPGRRRPQGSERLFLATQDEPYDLVLLMPDPRVRRRAGLVATVEFYTAVERSLTADGLFCQWWDPAFVDPDDLRAALASADAAFASATLVVDHPRSRRPLLGIVGTRRDLQVRPRDIRDHLDDVVPVRREMERVGLDPLLVSCLAGPAPGVTTLLAPSYDAVTDRRPALGSRGGRRLLENPDNLLAVRELLVANRSDAMEWTRVPAHLEGVAIAQSRAVHEAWTSLFRAARALVQRHGMDVEAFEGESPGGFTGLEAEYVLEACRATPDWPYLEDLVLERFRRLERSGRPEEAEDWLREALERDYRSTRFRMALAELMEADGEDAEATVLYRSILALTPGHPGALGALARLETD